MINLETLIMDEYERKARLYPALLLIAPIVGTVFVLLSIEMAIGATILISSGGAYLLTQLARDKGKEKEPKLFKEWGGMPSIVVFRHIDNQLDKITKAKYHEQLTHLVEGTTAPTIEQEEADPSSADEIYTAWSNYLRRNTRGEKFPLVRKELMNYGYRRNVYGMRPIGILVSLISLVTCAIRLYFVYHSTSQYDEALILAGVFSLVFSVLWIFQFTANWVRIPAVEYAKRLAESVDILSKDQNEDK